MKRAKSKYCGECLTDFKPGQIVWFSIIENRSFCSSCKPKLDIKNWEKRRVSDE